MNIKILFFFLFVPISLLGQNYTSCYNGTFQEERLVFERDTFMILKFVESQTEVFYEEEVENSYLFKINKGEVDTLISSKNYLGYNGEINDTYPVEEYLQRTLKPDKYANETDSTVYQYMSGTSITYLGEGVFAISDWNWEFTGGAHGYGHSTGSQYDLLTHSYFEFEDVFKPRAENHIYELACEDLKYNDLYEGMTKSQVDSATAESRHLSNDEYSFNKDHFSVVMQSYERLYGVFYAGYPGWYMDIPYKELKKYLIKDSPVWRLMKAEKQ